MNWKKFLQSLKFILITFGPVIVFFAADHFFSLKVAILSMLIFTLGDVIYQKYTKQKITSFYWFVVGITLVFGCVDLYMKETVFLKYEAGLTNFIFGIYFLYGAFAKKTFLEEFIEKSGKLPDPRPPNLSLFFKIMTALWAVYFIVKAMVYTFLAMRSTLQEMMGIRAVVGNISMIAMAFVASYGSGFIMKYLLKKRVPSL